jgi:hypothetical protein
LCHFRASRATRPPLNHFFEHGVRDMNDFGDLAQKIETPDARA